MAFEPTKITKEHILAAYEKIKRESPTLEPSTRWDVIINNETFPPKEIMRYAHEQMNGEHIWGRSGGEGTNTFLTRHGFEIIDKNFEQKPIAKMNQKILKRFKLINNQKAITKFFELLKSLTDKLNLSSENEKFSLTIREDSYKRISINLNGRLVFALIGNEEELEFRFMIDKENINYLPQDLNLNKKEAFVKTSIHAYHIDISANEILFQNTEKLIELWLNSCKDYEPTQDKSQYRKYHIPELYSLIYDDELLEKYLLAIKHNKATIWKLGCRWTGKSPLNYQLLKENNIVISDVSFAFQKDDLVLLTDGFWALGIVRVKEKMASITTKAKLEKTLLEHEIPFDDSIIYSPVEWYDLPENLQFEYKLQKGIRQIQQPKTREKVIQLWESRNKRNNLTMDNNTPHNQILFGPPGTGKTYNTIDLAVQIAEPTDYEEGNHIKNKETFDSLIKEGQIVFTTFHQSMSYEDFIEGIKPKTVEGKITYEVVNGIFKHLCKEASKSYLYSIEIEGKEIPLNKNLFEVMYHEAAALLPPHIENTSNFNLKTKEGYDFELYRNTNDSIVVKAGSKKTNMTLSLNELNLILFNDKVPFYKSYSNIVIDEFILKDKSFKENKVNNSQLPYILIIDEINRGNVSQIFGELITLIETDKRIGNNEALKVTLPYSKEEFGVPNNLYIIGTMNTADRSVEALDSALRRRFSFVEMPPKKDIEELQRDIEGFKLKEVLETINGRIEKLLDKDHLIGHSYFLKVKTLKDLQKVFFNNIIPLLQEYFLGDYGKIGLVIGSDFFENEGKKIDTVSFADFKGYDDSELEQREIYKLKNSEKLENEHFKNALNILLKRKSE
jgi:5-methylcytosine-specific restriction protein B